MSRAGLDKDPREVAAMFDGVASGYDKANSFMTFGFDRRWRGKTARALALSREDTLLDLAAGTGVSTAEFATSGAYCVAADFSVGMLANGTRWQVPKVAADALRLPFADGSFDAVSICFGIRNFVDPAAALVEIRRVTRPGGRLAICEVSTPPSRLIRFGHRSMVMPLLTSIGSRVSSNPDAYRYLAESAADWPDQRGLAEMIADAGWGDVAWRNMTMGVVALHTATKPAA